MQVCHCLKPHKEITRWVKPTGFTWGIELSKANELTIEQLIGIATTEGSAVSTLADDKSNVKNFLREYDVKDGSALVPNYKVYNDYCRNWQPTGKKLSKIGFLRKFSVVFEPYRSRHTRYYLLNKEAFDISEESLHEAKRFDKRYRNRIRKKGEQKKQNKASRLAKEIQSKDEAGLHRT